MPFPRLPALALAVALPLPAAAVPLQVDFSGSIDEVAPALASTFSTTQPVSGSFRYESTTADVQAADPAFANYAGAIGDTMSTATWQFGSYTATGTTGSVTVTLVVSSHRFDAYVGSTSGAAIGGYVPTGVRLNLTDTSAMVFVDDSLPTDLQLGDFDLARAWIAFDDGSGAVNVYASLSSLSVTPVPEPVTGALAVAGFATGLALRRRGAEPRP